MVVRPERSTEATPEPETQQAEAAPWSRRHLLDVDSLSREEILLLLETAEGMEEVLQRRVARTPALRGLTVVNLFYEASTRTRASFELAGKVLGADVINVAGSGSSVEKGESLIDTVRTLKAIGADVLVMRHPSSGAPQLAARQTEAHVINAGDGWHAHPTQALLDAYTLQKALGSLEDRRIVIVGDITHSRVARSNIWALTTLGARVTLCGPRTLLPRGLEGVARPRALPAVEIEDNLDRAIAGADAVMALRVQRERIKGAALPSLREYAARYQLNAERLALAAKGAPVLHPGPMNEGVEVSAEVAHGLQSEVERQVQHGVAVRMAALFLLARTGE
jgi:aspartate carbamoyltransferase catalytic subunit